MPKILKIAHTFLQTTQEKQTMNIKTFTLSLCALLCLPTLAIAKTAQSEFRPNTTLEFVYEQDLGAPYSVDWYAKMEKKKGKQRTVYIEAIGKYVQKGFVTFDCANPKADVKLALYNWGDFGDSNALENITVRAKDFKAWNADNLEALYGEKPPYALYKKLRTKYCK